MKSETVRRQLTMLLDSEMFRHAERLKRFLSYVVDEELAGRGERIGQFAIAIDVFDRDETFDPAIDSIVRVEARRLRSKLTEYYAGAGVSGQLVFTLPKGRYRLSMESHAEPAARIPYDDDGRPTVAVLPLDNPGGDPSDEYFSDGITEDIITDLSKISGLSVISRHSTFVYKGRSVAARDIGDDLGARFIVEGSVRRAGARVRITTQLIDTLTDSHLWAERYDRELGDIFAVQDEVSRLIVDALDVTLTEFESQRIGYRGTRNIEAHDLFLKAQEQFYQFRGECVSNALGLLDEAIALEPGFADAHAWRGRVLTYSALTGLAEPGADTIALAVDAARTATTADPQLAHGRAVLGWALVWAGESEGALRETSRALELEPNFADGYLWRAMALSSAGRGEDSLQIIDRGIRLNPHFNVTYLHALGLAHFALGQFDEVLVQCERGARRNSHFLPIHLLQIATLGHLNRVAEAVSALAMAAKLDPAGASMASDFFSDGRLRKIYTEGLNAAGY